MGLLTRTTDVATYRVFFVPRPFFPATPNEPRYMYIKDTEQCATIQSGKLAIRAVELKD